MCNNSFLLALTVLLCIIVIITFLQKNKKLKYNSETLTIHDLNKPNLSIENKTQFFYVNLLKNLKLNQNKKTVRLKSNCKVNKYTHSTTDEALKADIDVINGLIVDNLNKGHNYEFVKTNYGNIIELIDQKGVYNYIYNVFLQDVKNVIMINLKVNIIVFPDKNIKRYFGHDIETCADITTSAFPVYNIGIPSKNQYIPLPTEVIPTANDILSVKGVKYPRPIQPKYLYVNRLDILNSTLVVNPNKRCLSNFVKGKVCKSPEFTWVTGDHNPYIQKSDDRNQWPTLHDQPKCQGQWPCTPITQKWNTDGVYSNKPEPSKLCPGKTWATKDLALQAQYWRTLATVPKNSGENAWLFELSRGIPDFPTGSSV